MNRITLQPTIFVNHPVGDRTYGYRMYDDHGQTYCNAWDSIPDDDLDLLQQVMDYGDQIAQDMIWSMSEQGNGLYIGGTWYSWDEIEHLFSEQE